PLLGPLQHNGGPTFTHALLHGSPPIDAGDPNFTPPPFHGQRGPGFDRVRNGRIDVGSFEVQAGTTPTPTPTATSSPTPTATFTRLQVAIMNMSESKKGVGPSIYSHDGMNLRRRGRRETSKTARQHGRMLSKPATRLWAVKSRAH